MRKSLLIVIMALASIAGCAHQKPAAPVAQAKENPVIVSLVNKDQTVTIRATGHGPRYSVADKTGKTIVANATLDELRVSHPDIYRQLDPAFASESDASVSGPRPAGERSHFAAPRSSDGLIMRYDAR